MLSYLLWFWSDTRVQREKPVLEQEREGVKYGLRKGGGPGCPVSGDAVDSANLACRTGSRPRRERIR